MKEIILHNLKNILIAFDQLLNVLLCSILLPKQKHYADETISSHAYRWYMTGAATLPRKILDTVAGWFGDTDHCFESYKSERSGRQLPPELRQ